MSLKEFFNKTDLAFWKNFQNTSDIQKHFQKTNKILKNLFRFDHQQLSIHKSHLNMYNYTNEIGIH